MVTGDEQRRWGRLRCGFRCLAVFLVFSVSSGCSTSLHGPSGPNNPQLAEFMTSDFAGQTVAVTTRAGTVEGQILSIDRERENFTVVTTDGIFGVSDSLLIRFDQVTAISVNDHKRENQQVLGGMIVAGTIILSLVGIFRSLGVGE